MRPKQPVAKEPVAKQKTAPKPPAAKLRAPKAPAAKLRAPKVPAAKLRAPKAPAAKLRAPKAGKAAARPIESELGLEAADPSRSRRSVPAPTAPGRPRGSRDRSATEPSHVRELDWAAFASVARELAGQVTRSYDPQAVVGVAKGGVFVGAEVARALRCEFFPVRIGHRSRDVGGRAPEAAKSMPPALRGRRVLIVDDIAGTGATLAAAVEAAQAAGAAEVKTATLATRPGGFRPDWFALETDALLVQPWDFEPPGGATASAGDDPGELGV